MDKEGPCLLDFGLQCFTETVNDIQDNNKSTMELSKGLFQAGNPDTHFYVQNINVILFSF